MEKAKVVELIVENLHRVTNGRHATIDETSVLGDLGVDSLDVVELLMEVEDEFGVSIPDEKMSDCKTVSDLADLVIASAG